MISLTMIPAQVKVGCMKTTLNLNDMLVQEAKKRAAESGLTLT